MVGDVIAEVLRRERVKTIFVYPLTALTEFAVTRMWEEGMEVAMVETGADPGHEPARRTYEKAGFLPWPAVKFFKYL